MLVEKFYKQQSCSKLLEFEQMYEAEEGRYLIIQKILQLIAESLLEGKELSDILLSIKQYIAGYCEEWFSYEGQKREQQNRDYLLFSRFLNWYFLNMPKRVLKANVKCVIETQYTPDQKLEQYADLIVENEQGYAAFLFQYAPHSKSLKGKKSNTLIHFDLKGLCVKEALEKEYPNIAVMYVAIQNTEDEEVPGKFLITTSKKSNLFTMDYASFYENGIFQDVEFHQMLEDVLLMPGTKPCEFCKWSHKCGISESIKDCLEEEKVYSLPTFTEQQNEVIQHVEGPLLVCAGPGSGKTATIIGRIQYLVENKEIPPEFILVITFAKEAANELKNRCKAFQKEYEMPYISTLHALGYDIIRSCESYIGKKVLLTELEKMKLIESLTMAFPMLDGLNYNVVYGKYGLIKTLAGYLENYRKCDEESFYSKHTHLTRKFSEFAKMYYDIIERRGFITFDQQIALAVSLLKEYPEVKEQYQNIFKYIMVDEYQDIDDMQAEFIYLLAEHQNIVVVGDDDQSVYGFRGGTPEHMILFPERFHCKRIVLQDNFRAKDTIVEAAQKLIQSNKKRLDKPVSINRMGGVTPKIVPCNNIGTIENIIKDILSKGYSYKDCAILAFKNRVLEEIHMQSQFPSVLAKTYLAKDKQFNLVHDLLDLYFEDYTLNKLIHVGVLLGEDVQQFKQLVYTNRTAIEALDFVKRIHMMLQELEDVSDSKEFIYMVSGVFDFENTESETILINFVNDYKLHTLKELYVYMHHMIIYEDETRMNHSKEDAVLLITSHDAKGKEFPFVIVADGNCYEDTEESRRLFYVAITRAADGLYVLKEQGSQSTLLDGICEVDESLAYHERRKSAC